MIERAFSQRLLQFAQLLIQRVDCVANPQAEIERHLIVARARCVQTSGIGSDNFSQTRFDVHVNVFKGARKGESARLDFGADLL